MAQTSAPQVGVNLSDQDWRDLFGEEAGVVADFDGTSYALVPGTDSNTFQVGSASQRSVARVGGFVHVIPTGQPEPVVIPAAVGSDRTDIIALRYDPAFAGAPGPVRLTVITGSASGLPVYDDAPPGIEDLPLWAVTRSPGQSLTQAKKVQLFTRISPSLTIPAGASLPVSSPLGSVARQGSQLYRRDLNASGTPVWVQDQYVQAAAPTSAPEGAIWFQV